MILAHVHLPGVTLRRSFASVPDAVRWARRWHGAGLIIIDNRGWRQ